MRTAMTLLALSLMVGGAACKKKEQPAGTTGSATATMTATADAGAAADMGSGTMAGSDSGSGSAMAGSGSDAAGMAGSGAGGGEQMTNKAGNCPSTVFGSTTTSAVKGDTVVLTISATDKDAVASIQRRTEELLKEKADNAAGGGGGAHNQKGTHGGGVGICPVFFGEGGKATSKKDAKGVVITITPKEKPEELKTVIDGRITKASEWVQANVKPADQGNSGGVGGGSGEHGGNHSGSGDSKGKERKGDGKGGGKGTGGGGGAGTGGGGSGSAAAGSAK